ncbi:MAG: glycosyltransferase, partial [Anaerolineae bacterium]|nr:glycosyltransferase [Anaerolineae bacterium]
MAVKILHVTPYYTPAYAFGGVVRSVEGMARALARRGHEVTVLTTDAGDQHRRLEAPTHETLAGVQVIRARNLSPLLRGRFNLSTSLHLRRLAHDAVAAADVIHLHEFRTVENLLITPGLEKPLLLSPHGTLTISTGRSVLK